MSHRSSRPCAYLHFMAHVPLFIIKNDPRIRSTAKDLLDDISPIFFPFFPVFCAFSPPRRDGSNEPQARTQGQETAAGAKRGELLRSTRFSVAAYLRVCVDDRQHHTLCRRSFSAVGIEYPQRVMQRQVPPTPIRPHLGLLGAGLRSPKRS